MSEGARALARLRNLQTEKTRHGRTVYYYRSGFGKRVRLPDQYGSAEFEQAYKAAHALGLESVKRRQPLPTASQQQRRKIRKSLGNMLRSAKRRAEQAGQPFEIDLEWALSRLSHLKYRCEMTSIPFFARHSANCRVHPFGPSFDRKNPKAGYTKSNVRIVCYAVNVMLMDWGDDVFQMVVNHYQANKRTKKLLSIVVPFSTSPAPTIKQ